MKVIVAGSRAITNPRIVARQIRNSDFAVSEIVCGHAGVIERAAILWAHTHHIPARIFRPNWLLHREASITAGHEEMVRYADALIAIWDGVSAGVQDLLEQAYVQQLPTYLVIPKLGATGIWARGFVVGDLEEEANPASWSAETGNLSAEY